MKHTIELRVVVEASSRETADEMVNSLARLACDVANSTDDDEAFILVQDAE